MSDTTSVAEAIRKIRIHTCETQEKLAQALGVTVFTLARYENGVQPPKASIIAKLAQEAENRELPELATLFKKAFREKNEKAQLVRSLVRTRKAEGLIPRFISLNQSAEQLTKKSERLLKILKSHNGKGPADPEVFRILESARLTLAAQTKTIENLTAMVEQYASLDSQDTTE